MTNIKRDPFEISVGDDTKTLLGVGLGRVAHQADAHGVQQVDRGLPKYQAIPESSESGESGAASGYEKAAEKHVGRRLTLVA
jgi:hypothetical protein